MLKLILQILLAKKTKLNFISFILLILFFNKNFSKELEISKTFSREKKEFLNSYINKKIDEIKNKRLLVKLKLFNIYEEKFTDKNRKIVNILIIKNNF